MDAGQQSEFRPGLRVKGYKSSDDGVMEMTWADDGRALWRFGAPVRKGVRHVQWLRVGTHDIF